MSAGENSIANCWVADTVADFRGSYRIVRSALAPRRAEVARACGEIGALMIVSADAMLSIEEVAPAGNEPIWLQVFLYMDRSVTKSSVDCVQAFGYEALCLTIDCSRLDFVSGTFAMASRATPN